MNPLAIGACSGSLFLKSPAECFQRAALLGIEVIQLSAMPHSYGHLSPSELARQAREAGVEIVSCSVTHAGEDYTTLDTIRATGGLAVNFENRLDNFIRSADWLAEIGVRDITSHIGFIPEDPADPARAQMMDRVAAVVSELDKRGVRLAMETGQETAEQLKQFLDELDLPQVGVNLDPANMILYGAGDPVLAVDVLGKHIVSVHCKDAMYSDRPGLTWGREVPFGQGQVNADKWIHRLLAAGFTGPLVIERESHQDRIDDIAEAVRVIRAALNK